MTDFVVINIAAKTGLPEAEVEKTLDGWKSVEGFLHGVHVANARIKGNEIHLAIGEKYRRRTFSRKCMREFIKPMLDELGYLTTRVLIGHDEQERFVERVGFEKTWTDGRFNYYLLSNLPYERKAK